MKAGIKFALWMTLASALALPSTAQQQPSPTGSNATTQSQPADAGKNSPDGAPQQPGSQQKDQDKKSSIQEMGKGKVAGTSNDRLFYAMPNFLTLQGREKVPPLSSKDKFKVVALGTFDYFEYPWWGVLAAINQAENNEAGYGQGWAGYGKRYVSTAGDSLVENFLVGAVFPSVLHQDPRFYQSGGRGFFKRSGYAITRLVVTRSDTGKSQFNYSEVFGSAIAAGISTNTYHPRSTFVS